MVYWTPIDLRYWSSAGVAYTSSRYLTSPYPNSPPPSYPYLTYPHPSPTCVVTFYPINFLFKESALSYSIDSFRD